METRVPWGAVFKVRHRAEYAWFSISDSLAFISMPAEQAAAEIVDALRSEDAHRVLSVPARLASILHGFFPGATARFLGVINLALPRSGRGGLGDDVEGAASTSIFSPSLLTRFGDEAARRNNEAT